MRILGGGLKGLKHENEFKYFDKKLKILGLNKSLYWFLNFEDEPLMSCRLCNFTHGENIRKIHISTRDCCQNT
jgi:hypothetical protein